MNRTETRAFRALHQWCVHDDSLTKEEVVSRVTRCARYAVTAACRGRLAALLEWAEQFWD